MHKLALRIRSGFLNYTDDQMRHEFGWAHARWHELVENLQFLIDADPEDKFQDRELLLELAGLARRKGLDWSSWYKLRLCNDEHDDKCFPCRDTYSKTCPQSG